MFLDAKRPYTKDVLMRIDLGKVLERVSLKTIKTYLVSIKAPPCELDEEDLNFLRAVQGSRGPTDACLGETRPVRLHSEQRPTRSWKVCITRAERG